MNDVIIEVVDEAMLLAQLCRTDASDNKKMKKREKRPSQSKPGVDRDSNDSIHPNCTAVGGSGGGASASPGMALMTMLPQGMLCVPAKLNASCVDAASHRQAYLPKEVSDYLLPAHPKAKKGPVQDAARKGSRSHNGASRTAAAHLPASSLLSTLSGSTDGSLTEIADRPTGGGGGGQRSCAATSSFADSHLLSVQRMIEANLHAMHAKLGASRTPAMPPPPPHPTTTTKTEVATAKPNPATAPNPPGPSGKVKKTNDKSRRPDHPAHRTLEV